MISKAEKTIGRKSGHVMDRHGLRFRDGAHSAQGVKTWMFPLNTTFPIVHCPLSLCYPSSLKNSPELHTLPLWCWGRFLFPSLHGLRGPIRIDLAQTNLDRCLVNQTYTSTEQELGEKYYRQNYFVLFFTLRSPVCEPRGISVEVTASFPNFEPGATSQP